MKKIIRLTESDLTQIVKQVIIENNSKNSLIKLVREDGWQTASKFVGGLENLKRLLRIETPMDFLNIFTDLDVVESDEAPDSNLYRYEEGNNIMIYNRQRGSLYVNFKFTWLFLKEAFGLREVELEQLTQEWLTEAYNLNLRISKIGKFSNPKFAKLT